MGPQSDAHTFNGGGRPFDGSFRPLSHIRGAGPFRDGYPAVLPSHILLRSAADLSSTHGGPGTQRRLSWCSVRHVELDRRDGSCSFSGYQRRAARRDGKLEHSGNAGRRRHPGERRGPAVREGVESGHGRTALGGTRDELTARMAGHLADAFRERRANERQVIMSTVHEATYELLRSFKMTKVFGNPGSTELPFLRGFPEDFTYVLGLHEGAVVGMADGYAQGTGRAAFVNLHTAAGLGNASAAIMTAHHNRTPLVITAGQQDRRQLAYEPFLSGRLVEMAKPYVKWSHEPARAEDVPAAIARAYHTATQEPQGPVFVSIPMDDWEAEAPPFEARQVSQRTAPDPEALERVADALRESRRPAIVAGDGAARSGAWHEVVALAEKLNAPVWNEPLSAHVPFPQDHPLFQGHLASSRATLSQQLAEYDVVLVLGAAVFKYYPYAAGPVVEPDTRVLQVTDDPSEAARAATGSSVVGNVAT